MTIPSNVSSSSPDTRVSWSGRKIPLSRSRHVCGRVPWQPPSQAVDVESDLEARATAMLTRIPGLLALHSQPFTLTYSDAGVRRRYTPDLLAVFGRQPPWLVQLGFGRWTVIEVKPESKLDQVADDLARHHRAIREQLGFATVILTERHIPGREVRHES